MKILSDIVKDASKSIPKTRDYFSFFTFSQMADCRSTKRFIKDAIGTTCYQLIPKFWEQTIFTLYIGPLLVLFGCFNFCGVLTSRIKLIEKDIYGHGAVRQFKGGKEMIWI